MACRFPRSMRVRLIFDHMHDGTGTMLLEAVVGSTAYGLAREGSDIDLLGVFAAPTRHFWRLNQPAETIKPNKDTTYHEVEKYLRLAAKCNPSILELLWLDDYVTEHTLGSLLINVRYAFLSEHYVRAAYGGYALQQLSRLVRRNEEGKEGFSSDTKQRTAKHARHCFRLLRQGRELLETGNIVVRVEDPETYWEFDDMSVDEIARRFTAEDQLFQTTQTVLPSHPDLETVDWALTTIRKELL